MIDLKKMDGGQCFDESTNLVYPWYTKPFLDELATWDLSDKIIFEWGVGASTKWYANKCKEIYGVDNSIEWIEEVTNDLKMSEAKHHLVLQTNADEYANYIYSLNKKFDIIVIDGAFGRDECVRPAIDCLKDEGVILIDNWLQPSVWMASEETQLLLKDFDCKIYPQDGHPDWQTAVFTINKNI